jgi:hypothetical protein
MIGGVGVWMGIFREWGIRHETKAMSDLLRHPKPLVVNEPLRSTD